MTRRNITMTYACIAKGGMNAESSENGLLVNISLPPNVSWFLVNKANDGMATSSAGY